MIGGSRDGQFVDLPANAYAVNVPVPQGQIWWKDTPLDTDISLEVETYVKQQIRGETMKFTVLVPAGWTGDDLIRKLIYGSTV